jgi:hypothetical protein
MANVTDTEAVVNIALDAHQNTLLSTDLGLSGLATINYAITGGCGRVWTGVEGCGHPARAAVHRHRPLGPGHHQLRDHGWVWTGMDRCGQYGQAWTVWTGVGVVYVLLLHVLLLLLHFAGSLLLGCKLAAQALLKP